MNRKLFVVLTTLSVAVLASGCGGAGDEQSTCEELRAMIDQAPDLMVKARSVVEKGGMPVLTCPNEPDGDGIGVHTQAVVEHYHALLGVGLGSHCACCVDGFFMCTGYVCVCDNSDGSVEVRCY